MVLSKLIFCLSKKKKFKVDFFFKYSYKRVVKVSFMCYIIYMVRNKTSYYYHATFLEIDRCP